MKLFYPSIPKVGEMWEAKRTLYKRRILDVVVQSNGVIVCSSSKDGLFYYEDHLKRFLISYKREVLTNERV